MPSGATKTSAREDYEGDYPEALRAIFGPDIPKSGHHIKDIQRRLMEYGIVPENWVFDTALAAYLLDATASGYELDWLGRKDCGFDLAPAAEEDGQISLLPEQHGAVLSQAIQSAAAIGRLEPALRAKLAEFGMERLYFEIELPLCAVLAYREHTGVLIDRDALFEYGESLTGEINALQSSIYELAGESFNINSPKQLGNILFDKLMLPAGKKTKTGWSTNADVLEKLLRGRHAEGDLQ